MNNFDKILAQPYRTPEQAAAEIEARRLAEIERNRLRESDPAHCREILAGAFERRYEAGVWVGYWDMSGRKCDFLGNVVED